MKRYHQHPCNHLKTCLKKRSCHRPKVILVLVARRDLCPSLPAPAQALQMLASKQSLKNKPGRRLMFQLLQALSASSHNSSSRPLRSNHPLLLPNSHHPQGFWSPPISATSQQTCLADQKHPIFTSAPARLERTVNLFYLEAARMEEPGLQSQYCLWLLLLRSSPSQRFP